MVGRAGGYLGFFGNIFRPGCRSIDPRLIELPLPLALDVACGTGHSSAILLSIAERVMGIDISFNMLAQARRDARIRYVQA